MELFSEIYSCYYQVLRHLLSEQNALSMQARISSEGFEESMFSIIPKLEDGSWNLFRKEGELYFSRLTSSFMQPLSDLEKSYLKAILSGSRIGLFLDSHQLEYLNRMLDTVTPLWKPEQFFYYDQFADRDSYQDETYRNKFRLLAIKQDNHQKMRLEILNLSRMQSVTSLPKTLSSDIDLNTIIRNTYYKEPLKLHIVNKRNALERAMLHFANYEKKYY